MGRFGRVAEAFEAAAKVGDCDSSGSEHSTETVMDLSDLVNLFIENGDGAVVNEVFDITLHDECSSDEIKDNMEGVKESLRQVLRSNYDDDVTKNISLAVEKVWGQVNIDHSSPHEMLGSNRWLMARLRDKGLDAGLCKSKWEKKGRLLAGDFEYIDVNVDGTRYIIIVSLLEEFEIARPTNSYASLLETLPQILVCKVDELKEMVRIMLKAVKKSMNQMKMAVPPWRRREYVQAKWFGSYKRTTNEFPTKNTTNLNINNKKTIGFKPTSGTCYGRHKEGFGRKDFGFKMGNLTMVMNGAT